MHAIRVQIVGAPEVLHVDGRFVSASNEAKKNKAAGQELEAVTSDPLHGSMSDGAPMKQTIEDRA